MFTEIKSKSYVDLVAEMIEILHGKEVVYTLPAELSDDASSIVRNVTDYMNTKLSGVEHVDGGRFQAAFEGLIQSMIEEKIMMNFERVKMSPSFASAMLNLGLFNPHDRVIVPDILLELCKSDDEHTLGLIEQEAQKLDSEAEAVQNQAALVAYGDAVYKISRETLSYVTGLNKKLGYTGAQIDQLQTEFQEVEDWLRRERPGKALGILKTMQPTPVAPQNVIDDVKLFLENKLARIA